MKRLLLIGFLQFGLSTLLNAVSPLKIGLLRYNGGGDWYANPTALPNLIRFCNREMKMNLDPEPVTTDLSSQELFSLPFLHMTGHGNVVFNNAELENLRTYLKGGGFLHIDDNYGMDKFIRPQLQKLFPGTALIEIPYRHPVFSKPFSFPAGLPKVHEHDNRAPQAFGLFYEGRLCVIYTFECDLGDGWEDADVHRDSEEVRKKALQMGANILGFALSQ